MTIRRHVLGRQSLQVLHFASYAMGKFFHGLCFLKHLDRKNRGATLVEIVFEFSAELVELGGVAE